MTDTLNTRGMTILGKADFAWIHSWSMFDSHLTWHLSFLAFSHSREGSWGVIENQHIYLTCSLNKRGSGNFYINSNRHWHQGIRGLGSQVQHARYYPRERSTSPQSPVIHFLQHFCPFISLLNVHTRQLVRHSCLSPPLSLTAAHNSAKGIITCTYLPIVLGHHPSSSRASRVRPYLLEVQDTLISKIIQHLANCVRVTITLSRCCCCKGGLNSTQGYARAHHVHRSMGSLVRISCKFYKKNIIRLVA